MPLPSGDELTMCISDVVGEHDLDVEAGGRVVLVVERRPAVLERHGVLRLEAFDADRTLVGAVLLDGPLGDIDVVGAPVGHLAAGVFVPPAELVVRARVAVGIAGRLVPVVDQRGLTEPALEVEGGRDVGLWGLIR